MSLYESLLRPILYRLDPERAHELGLHAIAHGLVSTRVPNDPRLRQELFGVSFHNPLGLAAGFDKNAIAVAQWQNLGFGFVEIGTVTAQGQPGNPKPRMFRLPDERALINRLGFNNEGAEAVARRLEGTPRNLPLGINLGKTKVTSLEGASADYRTSFARLANLGDYFVVNVSSPNTPGLRSLQDKGPLRDIFGALAEVRGERPLFVKVAPDLTDDALADVIEVATDFALTGMIATNTTLSRSALRRDPGIEGGLSGAPLTARADEVLAFIARHAPHEFVLIGVGGVMTPGDFIRKIELGAHLVQTYTGFVYGGPGFPARCLEALIARLDRDGMRSVAELREPR